MFSIFADFNGYILNDTELAEYALRPPPVSYDIPMPRFTPSPSPVRSIPVPLLVLDSPHDSPLSSIQPPPVSGSPPDRNGFFGKRV